MIALVSEGLYVNVLASVIVVVCLVAIVTIVTWSLPDALRSYRREVGASRAFAGWLLSRTIITLVCLIAFVALGVIALTLPADNVVRIQSARLLIIFGIIGYAVIGTFGPVERRSIQRAVRDEDQAREDAREQRMDRLEEKQERDLKISELTRGMVNDIQDAQRQEKIDLGEQQRVHDDLQAQEERMHKDLEEERKRKEEN